MRINRFTSNIGLSAIVCITLCACDSTVSPVSNVEKTKAAISTNPAQATSEVQISDAWVREMAPGQSVGAGYMTLTSPQDSSLVYVESALASSVEIHSMSMENNVMKMRMLEELQLKAGKPEKLAPGGFHLMLFDLKAPLKAGETVALTLCFKDGKGNITHQEVTLPVKAPD
jgi:periplasmic copper chaperone A